MKKLIIALTSLLLVTTASAANLYALTNGSVSGTSTLSISSQSTFGGVVISADGTNSVTVIVRLNDSAGKIIFKLVTKSPGVFIAPVYLEGQTEIWYSVSGTNGAAQFYSWQ